MIRLLLYILLFYLIYHIGKKLFQFLFAPQREVKGNAKKQVKTFDPKDIEDIDYEEVDKNDN